MKCEWTLDQLKSILSATLVSSVQDRFVGVGTDSRKDLSGQLFIALKGDVHDAHKYLASAVEKGAAGLVVHDLPENLSSFKDKVSIFQVDDTLKALQALGAAWRNQFKAQVVAITGSNGKTSTKEFAQVILSTQFKTFKSPASFNNHWGVPLSLLEVDSEDEVALIEMGMNNPGEIAPLCDMATPDVALVTTVGRAHIGNMGSQQAVADEKAQVYQSSPNAVHVFNRDNEHTADMFDRAVNAEGNNRLLGFSSFQSGVEVKLRATRMDLEGIEVQGQIDGVEGTAVVPVFGRHNVTNVMAASCIALAVGVTPENIWKALPKISAGWGRNQVVHLKKGTQVLFDAYNANPDSMAALIKNLYEIPVEGQKVVVLGEMLELGEGAAKLHEELGEMVGNTDVDLIWFVGPNKASFEAGLKRSDFQKTYYLSSTYEQSLAIKIGSMLHQQDIVVIKGSRGVQLEKVLLDWEPTDFWTKK